MSFTQAQRALVGSFLFYLSTLLISCGSISAQGNSQLTQAPPRPIKQPLLKNLKPETGPVIPGLRQHAIPQGLAFSGQHKAFFITHYFDFCRSSAVSVIDKSTKKVITVRELMESDKALHFGHVGGIGVSSESVWVASEGQVFQYSLKDLMDLGKAGPLSPNKVYKTETRASFCTLYKNFLYVGEFAHMKEPGKKYKPEKHHRIRDRKGKEKHAWVCAYDIRKDFKIPEKVLSIRQKVQGMHITDEHVYLSVSYGRNNDSKIAVYKNLLDQPTSRKGTLKDGTKVDLWFLDGKNHVNTTKLPAMSEGLTMIDGKLVLLFESGATKYQRGGNGPIDELILIEKSKLMP